MSILGTRVVRVEDPGFLTAGAVYTEDLVDERLAGAAHAVFVRSPVAHADLAGLDTSAASVADGVLAVFTAADLSDLPRPRARYRTGMVEMPLATDRVRYVGQPVAVVLAESRSAATDAAELVDVDYRMLPAVVDPRQAMRDEVLLFDEVGTNTARTSGGAPDPALLEGCEVVVTAEIVNARVLPAPLEGRGAAAVWGQDGRLIFWCPNQGAQSTKSDLVRALGIDPGGMRLITPDVGGAFGAKFGADPEHVVVAAAARLAGRPVRWTETRSENLTAMTHGRGQYQTVTIGGSRDGRMIAYRLQVLQDCGAYPRIGVILPSLTERMAPGVYDFQRVEVATRSVVTTTTPMGAYRGAGRPEAAAALERAVDLFAAEIGMDPAEVRRRNMLPAFTEPHTAATGAVYDVGDYPAALQKVLDAAGYQQLRAEQEARRARGDERQLGIGLAVYVEITGGGDESGPPHENATVEVHSDGSATVLTGTSPHGQGHATVWAMLVSEELGIPLDRITVRWGDTDLIPEGGGTGGSRSLQQGGLAVRAAARDVVELAKQRAATLLEVDPVDLSVDTGRAGLAVVGVPDRFVSFAELAASDALRAHTVFSAPGATYPFGAHLAVVEVDVPTGKTTLQRLVAVDDSGTIVNPLLAEGQRHGGLAQGAAQALLEEVLFDTDGNPLTASFADYGIVSAPEMPDFELVPMETPTHYNPLGAKGIGESGTIGATPAVQNAVIDAVAHLGVRHIDMPTTPQRVWRAIQEAVR
jgi:carbon-monoxide dehydrogenase large subunit